MQADTPPRKNYAIMRYAKIKTFGALKHVCNHNTRAVTGENIREDAPPPLELLETGSDDFGASVYALLDELGIGKGTLKDKVLAVETVTTASRGWFEKASENDKQQWLDANVAWARAKFGRGLITAKLHLDEEVWHIHFVAVPVVEKARKPRGARPKDPYKLAEYEQRVAAAPMRWTLSYHDILGGSKERLGLEQDAYHAAVAHLGLERGETQREDIEIELGNELTVSALALSRGHNPDGTARPRRSMTPAEGRNEIKRLRREAEAAKQEAQAVREQAEAELASATAAHLEADHRLQEISELRVQAALQRDEVTAIAQQLGRERAALDDERYLIGDDRQRVDADRRDFEQARAEAVQRREDQQVLLNLRADDLDVREKVQSAREAELVRREREASQAAEAARSAMVAAEHARNEVAADAQAARMHRVEAEAEHRKAESERQALATARAQLDDERAEHASQIALLARASDPRSGLDLRATEADLTMNTSVMTDREKSAYTRPWSAALIQIGREVARMFEELRIGVVRLLAREQAVAERETALSAKEAAAERDLASQREVSRAKHEAAIADIARRSETLGAEEVRLAGVLKDAERKWTEAKKVEADAKAASLSNMRWSVAINVIAEHPDSVEFTKAGALRLTSDVEAMLPPAAIEVVGTRPPAWALAIIDQGQALAENRASALKHERAAAASAQQLTDLIEKAGPVLTPAQQEMDATVRYGLQQWAARNSVNGRLG